MRRISIYQALYESRWSSPFLKRAKDGGDILHNNSLERVPESLAARLDGVAPGDWLLVFRDVNALAILKESTGKIVWHYKGDPPHSFVSIFSGNVARLDGGNLLTSVSCSGFAVELTPEGQVVWEFHSPHRAGGDKELVAVLFDVQRLAPLTAATWLNKGK